MGDISKHFSAREFASPDTGQSTMSPAFINRLERMRVLYGHPMVISSGFRTIAHNKAVGGSPRSMHPLGRAADILWPDESVLKYRLIEAAFAVGFLGIGVYEKHLHVDDRTPSMIRGAPTFWRG